MKKSNYNYIFEVKDGKKLAFNSMSCALAEIDQDFSDVLENIENIDIDTVNEQKKELIENMRQGNYIIDDAVDELKQIKFRHFKGKYENNSLSITIAPTLNCNFKCPYCYETPDTHIMDEAVQQSIIDRVEKQLQTVKNVQVTWYGGEPLLAKDIIWNVSEKIMNLCEQYGANYYSFIVSNGYLIDDETIENLIKYKITNIQVTIDGPKEIHDKRRIQKSGKGSFDKILYNVKKLKEKGFNINIRINIDKTNVARVEELLDILKLNDLNGLSITLGQVTAYTQACSSVSGSCLNNEEYAVTSLDIQKILNDKEFEVQDYPYYPGIKANYCCADQINAFVIDPWGDMYKCWNDIGLKEKSVGNITKELEENDDINQVMNQIDWLTQNPFDEEDCVECDLLPICMGGCPYNKKENKKLSCEKWKYNMKEILAYTYQNSL
ncbi:radical SAM/SPASM domain-containing protein [Tepidibacter hydrothermalis]|uniref:Radical SAM protein n=1 Tax=Tepidibacter hydrothermalis TaxID=3036126 RepID=A0ABY8ECX9_9FIRM|nr:radical SAM protein [Tepidibacter hydrothermalis]WFD10772.1 radical SAM protein [Tepidibacter hydrothermalis]